MASYLLLASLAVGAYLVASTLVSWYHLRQFPGPRLASVSYLWMARTAYSGKSYKIHMKLRERYNSPLIRIGPDVLVTDDPSIVRRMNAARSQYKRDQWYTSFRADPYYDSMISTQDDAVHMDFKTKATPAYTGKDVPTLEADVDGQLVAFKKLIRDKYISTPGCSRPMDLGRAMPWFTLDSISKLAFGQEFGHIKTDSDISGISGMLESGSIFAVMCADTPPLRRIVFSRLGLRLLGPKETDKGGLGYVNGLAKRLVTERFATEKPAEKRDMLGSFIRHGLTPRQCQSLVPEMLLAGSETTASTMRTTLLYIMTAPRVYQRLQAEIDEAIASGRVSSLVITQAQAQTLPYLQAVIYEGLRIHPPHNILFLKAVPPQGDTLDNGIFVPGGAKIALNTWSLLRDKRVFGDDADIFRPERFLEAENENEDAADHSSGSKPNRRVEMERHVELVFGNGRYMCAGKAVAMMELSKVYFELLRDFDFQIVDPKNPLQGKQYSTFIVKDMWVTVTERKKVAG